MTESRVPTWTVRMDSEGRHYSWDHFESYEDAMRTVRGATSYLHAIGEDPTHVRILHSVRIKVTAEEVKT